VDDHAIIREGLTMLINNEDDLQVCAAAENAEQALAEIEKDNIDLAVVDISLEGTSGLQLTERIKARNHHLPVLILTMHDEEIYAKRAFRAGAKGFITKHEASETVITAIRMMLAGHDYISDSMTQKFLRKLNSLEKDS
jgi:DNA-binding NarL/FixJ family response regulator